MICIFCKSDSSDSAPLEHIIPESLGNKEHIVERGAVCGKCNNYFSSKVERPFLGLPVIIMARFCEAVLSKKGRIPTVEALLLPHSVEVVLSKDKHTGETSVLLPEGAADEVLQHGTGTLLLPHFGMLEPNRIVSRFMAKVALEALCHRVEGADEYGAEIAMHPGLDPIREHARRGDHGVWPVGIRKIYDSSTAWMDGNCEPYQIMHEFDFLYTDENELYFVLVLFGQELVINLGGKSLEGWERWLDRHDHRSPLQVGKNAGETQIQ